eukprot:463770-Rhodomonas_salina.2
MDDFTTLEISTFIHAHGLLRLRPESALLDALRARATDKVKEFQAEELSRLLWAFSVLSLDPEPALVQQNASLSSPKKGKGETPKKGTTSPQMGKLHKDKHAAR